MVIDTKAINAGDGGIMNPAQGNKFKDYTPKFAKPSKKKTKRKR